MQQAVDAAEVDEGAVVGQVLDRAAHDRAFLQVVHERIALGGEFLLDDRAARHHDVVALLVELDDLEFERLVLEVRGVAHRAHVDQRAGQERAHGLDVDREAALDAAGDDAGDDLAFVEGLLEARPGARALGLFARQARLAGAVFDRVERHFDLVARLDLDFAVLVLELVERHHRFGLQSDVDDDDVGRDLDDEAHQNRAGTNALVRQALFEHLAETFAHGLSRASARG